MSQVLNVKNLTQRFGGLVALEHVDMLSLIHISEPTRH